ncbi:hypothetical protein [Dehalobacter sp. 4CP]
MVDFSYPEGFEKMLSQLNFLPDNYEVRKGFLMQYLTFTCSFI